MASTTWPLGINPLSDRRHCACQPCPLLASVPSKHVSVGRVIHHPSRLNGINSVSRTSLFGGALELPAGRETAQVASAYVSERTPADWSVATWQKLDDCFLVLPRNLPHGALPKGIIHFLGGAFVGAVPDRSYRRLIALLAEAGYIVLAVPYNVTFDHSNAAWQIHGSFRAARDFLISRGCPGRGWTPADLQDLPVYGLGHSNGSLMHVMAGCLFDPGSLPSAIISVSFNNRPVSEAVPFFDMLGPTVKNVLPAIESFPLTGIALSLAEQALQEASQLLPNDSSLPLPLPLPLPLSLAAEDLDGISRFADQLGPVFSQVREGVSEFLPSPSENRRSVATAYDVPSNLLIKFSNDTIDETDTLKALLDIRMKETGGRVDLVELTGTHATPLAQDFLRVGEIYSPLDAIGQLAQSMSQSDLRTLAKTITEWLDSL